MSDTQRSSWGARDRVRHALEKAGVHLDRDELDKVMKAFEEPKSKAPAAKKQSAAKPAAKKGK